VLRSGTWTSSAEAAPSVSARAITRRASSRMIDGALSAQAIRTRFFSSCEKRRANFRMILTEGGLTLSFSIPDT
jgi:hypothetical protein